jgi:hypothetical protein
MLGAAPSGGSLEGKLSGIGIVDGGNFVEDIGIPLQTFAIMNGKAQGGRDVSVEGVGAEG